MLTSPSAKPCIHCGKDFTPKYSAMQVACSLRCAASHAKKQRLAKEKVERETTKKRKEAVKRLPQIKAEAQAEFNKWVRARDREQPCISCGAPPPNLATFHAGRDAGHYRSVGSAAHLRFNEANCHAQCVHCNQHLSGNHVSYRAGLLARIGPDAVAALEVNNEVRKFSREELIAIKHEYRQKLKELQKENA